MLSSLVLVLALGVSPQSFERDTVRADAEIRQVVLRHAADIRRCYESEGLRRNPALTGHLELEVTILPTGRVDGVALAASSMSGSGATEVARCIKTAARHWRFDRGAYPVETIVLPLRLTPDQAEERAAPAWA